MHRMARWVLLVGVCAVSGCTRQVTDGSLGVTSSSGGGLPLETFVLDFSSSANGGTVFGDGYNVAFLIDLTQSTRSYSFKNGEAQTGPGFSSGMPTGSSTTGFDLGCPVNPQIDGVTKQEAALEAGQAANVHTVDLDLAGSYPGILCFAYRAEGVWHYDAATFPSDGTQAHLVLDKGPIDAVMLQQSHSHASIKKITYTVVTP